MNQDFLQLHRRKVIAHLIALRKIDAEYARYSLAEYKRKFIELFPEIDDVLRDEWAKSRGVK